MSTRARQQAASAGGPGCASVSNLEALGTGGTGHILPQATGSLRASGRAVLAALAGNHQKVVIRK